MNLTISKIIIDQFKGISHAEYDISKTTEITGKNATGKTTIADAYYWLFTDKDYSRKSNPEVHPDFMTASEPSVTIVCNLDGKELTLRKFQKDSRTKKQIEDGIPVRISNQYEINAVPKSQKDFFAYLQESGMDIDGFLNFAHPETFTDQKSADARKKLFDMVVDLTDLEIAKSTSGCESVGTLLESYTIEEIQAMKKREKKEADENIEAIPNQIIGLEKAKVEINKNELLAQKTTLQAEVDALEEELASTNIPSIGELNQRIVLLEKEQRQLTAEANAERVEKLSKINAEIGALRNTMSAKSNSIEIAKDSLVSSTAKKTAYEKQFQDLKVEFDAVKSSEFNAEEVCPYCGQDMPVKRLADAKDKFEEDKQNKLNDINLRAKKIQDSAKLIDEEIRANHKMVKELDAELIELQKELDAKISVRTPLETVIDSSGSDEQVRIMQEIIKVRHEIEKHDDLVRQDNEKRAGIRERTIAIRELDDILAQEKNNDRIEEQIADLKQKQKDYAQSKADAENILYQLQKISMAKNNMLEEQVNSHFTRVKFRLFVIQKNGEVKDDCTPMVLTKDGEYRDATFSANTAALELAKLDIINGLQKHYNQHVPVFLDGAECMDAESKAQINVDTQLVLISVTDDELNVEGK